jgi:hypothetical protein
LHLEAERQRQHQAAKRAHRAKQAAQLAQVEAQALGEARAEIEGPSHVGGRSGADGEDPVSVDGGRTTRDNSDDELQVCAGHPAACALSVLALSGTTSRRAFQLRASAADGSSCKSYSAARRSVLPGGSSWQLSMCVSSAGTCAGAGPRGHPVCAASFDSCCTSAPR